MEYLSFVPYPGPGDGDSAPAVDESGRISPLDTEQVLLGGTWRELRVHRNRITTDPAVLVLTGGTLLVTDRRVAWLTTEFDTPNSATSELATIAVTGSLVAGWLVGKASRRRQRQRVHQAGVVAGQVLDPWLDYVGFEDRTNLLRLGVRERFTDRNMPVTIDLTLASDLTARSGAEALARSVRASRQPVGASSAPCGAPAPQDELPGNDTGGRVAGVNLTGWVPVNGRG